MSNIKNNFFEFIIGLIILGVTIYFSYFVYLKNEINDIDGYYKLNAEFDNIGNLSADADVKIAGVKIGYVKNIILDDKKFVASVAMYINKNVDIPADSRAIIASESLIGSKYIKISPGGEFDNLDNDAQFQFTQSTLEFEDIVSKVLYSLTNK